MHRRSHGEGTIGDPACRAHGCATRGSRSTPQSGNTLFYPAEGRHGRRLLRDRRVSDDGPVSRAAILDKAIAMLDQALKRMYPSAKQIKRGEAEQGRWKFPRAQLPRAARQWPHGDRGDALPGRQERQQVHGERHRHAAEKLRWPLPEITELAAKLFVEGCLASVAGAVRGAADFAPKTRCPKWAAREVGSNRAATPCSIRCRRPALFPQPERRDGDGLLFQLRCAARTRCSGSYG